MELKDYPAWINRVNAVQDAARMHYLERNKNAGLATIRLAITRRIYRNTISPYLSSLPHAIY